MTRMMTRIENEELRMSQVYECRRFLARFREANMDKKPSRLTLFIVTIIIIQLL